MMSGAVTYAVVVSRCLVLSVTLCYCHDVRCCQLRCVSVLMSGAVSYAVFVS